MFDRSRRNLFRRQPNATVQRLPWVIDEEQFIDACTRCGKCLEQCETNIIVKGDGGFPIVDFQRGECTFCYQCANACPESLFHPQEQQPWQQHAVISDACLAQKKIECRSCGDMCDEQAIRFKLQVGGVAQPIINTDACTGCGACVAVCPTQAVAIKPNEH